MAMEICKYRKCIRKRNSIDPYPTNIEIELEETDPNEREIVEQVPAAAKQKSRENKQFNN